MARKVVLDTGYIFIPSANRITFDKSLPRERILLITNLSSNTVLFNFSDPNLKINNYQRSNTSQIAVTGTPGTSSLTNLFPQVTPIVGQRITGYGIPANSFIVSVSGVSFTINSVLTADPYINSHTPSTLFGTIVILNYNTSSMNASDKLQIFVDEYEETFRPAEVLVDPVSKMRVSTPQALIDTDFEYGLQPTKWESIQLVDNRPSYYNIVTTPINVSALSTNSGLRTISANTKISLSGTITTTTNNQTVTGVNTTFSSSLKGGSLLYSTTGAFIGAIQSVQSDTSATLKANALVVVTAVASFATGQRFFDNGSPGTGIFSGSGTLTVNIGSTSVAGQGTTFISEIRIGDKIFDPTGALIGTIATITSNTSATLIATSLVTTSTSFFEISQYTTGNPIFVQYSLNADANGSFLISGPVTGTLADHTTFSYDMEVVATSTANILDIANTNIYPGYFYTGQQISGTSQATFTTDAVATNSTITVTTGSTPHGLQPGCPIFIVNTSQASANGNWYVARISSPTSFEYVTQATVSVAPTGGQVYVRPIGGTLHRPFDGGLKISTGTNSPGSQLIRQTRRYFRYQSGKGVQFSTGTILKPSISVDSLVSNGTSVLVTCKDPHFLYPGAQISVSGATSTNGSFNGTFSVSFVDLSPNTLRYTPTSVPSSQTAEGLPINVSVTNWTNANVRLGLFDNQNGFCFRYDGTILSVCRRSSIDQLSGTVRTTSGSSIVTGVNTRFASQLKPGNTVVIRGQTYLITTISNDTLMTVSPEYRGVTISTPASAYISKTIDLEISQSDWNIDTCDGNGPSGYNLDLSKIQMFYIDYSWYGAGAIRYGFKDQRGEVIYCHRITHANSKTEAFMRSGNIPARYQTDTIPYTTILTSTLSNLATTNGTISVQDTTGFPASGFIYIDPPTGQAELISYSAKSTTGFTIAARTLAGQTIATNAASTSNALSFAVAPTGVSLYQHVHGVGIPVGTFVVGISGSLVYVNNPVNVASAASIVFKAAAATTAQAFTFSATSPIAVYSYGPTFAPNISHWGSSVIMDGRYDDDKSLIFTAGMQNALSVATSGVNALISLRAAPAVDSGNTGLLGVKELINRMQLTLDSSGCSADGRFLIEVRLNGQVSSGTWQNLGGTSLSQVCYHAAGTTISGGESLFSFYTNTGTGFIVTSVGLEKARDLGNSVLGGGTTNNARDGYFPDGPDMITIVARNIDSAAKSIVARVSWKEAQA